MCAPLKHPFQSSLGLNHCNFSKHSPWLTWGVTPPCTALRLISVFRNLTLARRGSIFANNDDDDDDEGFVDWANIFKLEEWVDVCFGVSPVVTNVDCFLVVWVLPLHTLGTITNIRFWHEFRQFWIWDSQILVQNRSLKECENLRFWSVNPKLLLSSIVLGWDWCFQKKTSKLYQNFFSIIFSNIHNSYHLPKSQMTSQI